MIPIYENYKGYRPPKYAYPTIVKLLSNMPSHYLSGLESVVLTNGAALGKGKTGRIEGKKHTLHSCLGFYHPRSKGEQAWIEVVVDNIVAYWFAPGALRFLSHIAFFRDIAFAETLYHELGHHLDRTIGPLARGSESNAEAWKGRLTRGYIRKRHWYVEPLFRIANVVDRARQMRHLHDSERKCQTAALILDSLWSRITPYPLHRDDTNALGCQVSASIRHTPS